jgi:hypothetical protein
MLRCDRARVDLPASGGDEAVQFFRGGGLDGGMLRPRANFGDGRVIDGAGGAREVGKDVLIVRPARHRVEL